MIVIHTEKNEKIGVGHYTRCSAIADELRLLGEDVCMASMYEFVDANLALIDGYGLQQDYFRSIHSRIKTAYIDDLYSFAYDVDLLINYTLGADTDRYIKLYGAKPPQLLIGSQYVPLRSQFKNIEKNLVSKSRKDVLILTGGSDYFNIGIHLANYILTHNQYDNIIFHIVAGEYNAQYDEIVNVTQCKENINIYRQVVEMEKLMCKCDIAISAAGSTLYELCACGIPTVTYMLADNQTNNYNAFTESNLMFGSGDCRGNINLFCNDLFRLLDELLNNSRQREHMASTMSNIVDGLGASRIAKTLIKLKDKE